jgi:hypothetical protein
MPIANPGEVLGNPNTYSARLCRRVFLRSLIWRLVLPRARSCVAASAPGSRYHPEPLGRC